MNGILTTRSNNATLNANLCNRYHEEFAFVPSTPEMAAALLLLNNRDGLEHAIAFLANVAALVQESQAGK